MFLRPLERGPTSTSNFSRMETEILGILLTPSVGFKIRWVLTPKKTTSQYKCVGFCHFLLALISWSWLWSLLLNRVSQIWKLLRCHNEKHFGDREFWRRKHLVVFLSCGRKVPFSGSVRLVSRYLNRNLIVGMVLLLLLLLMAINDWWWSMIDGDDADEWWSVLINDDQCLTSMIINDDQCWSSIMINDDDQWPWWSLMMVKLQIILILLARRPRPEPSEATEGLGGVLKAAFLATPRKRGLDTNRSKWACLHEWEILPNQPEIASERLQFFGHKVVHGIFWPSLSFRRYILKLSIVFCSKGWFSGTG